MKPYSGIEREFGRLWWLFILPWATMIVAVAIQVMRMGEGTWAGLLLASLGQAVATIFMARAHWKREFQEKLRILGLIEPKDGLGLDRSDSHEAEFSRSSK